MDDPLNPPFGSKSGNENICVRRSGLAFNSDHREPSALIASEHCVRAFVRIAPVRNPEQLTQAQFHCGTPPPAAEPRIWIRTDLRSYDSRLVSESSRISVCFRTRLGSSPRAEL